MRRGHGWLAVLAALALPALSAAACGTAADARHAGAADRPGPPPVLAVSARVGVTPVGQPLASGFVGVSFEFGAVRSYTGPNPRALNPVLVGLLRGLAPGQSPVIRIGGNSTDASWWPVAGQRPPRGVTYAITSGWLQTTRALAAALDAHLIVGVNLAAGSPALAGAEAGALVGAIGRRHLQALEIGNEPDLYVSPPWGAPPGGLPLLARGASPVMSTYSQAFTRWSAALAPLPLAAPAFAQLSSPTQLQGFVASAPRLGLVTVHRYPLRSCYANPLIPAAPSIQRLLSDGAAAGYAAAIAPYVSVAHARGLPLRVGEMNSAACEGRPGVSDTFASALWVLDTLFDLAAAGVDGVNLHSLPGAPYQLFSFTRGPRSWSGFVHPVYYGMLLFAQAFPPGARRLAVAAPGGPVKVWATRSPEGRIRVVVINKSTGASARLRLGVPGAGRAHLEWLRARSAAASAGVTLGSHGFGTATATGVLPAPAAVSATAVAGNYALTLPPASALLLTQ